MAIGRLPVPITVYNKDTGLPIAGASVLINFRSTGAAATLFSGETGNGVVTNPATTDATGRVAAWLNRGQYVAVITGTGISNVPPQPFDISPGGDKTVDSAWVEDNAANARVIGTGAVGTDELANASVTTDKLAARSVGLSKLADGLAGRLVGYGNFGPYSVGPTAPVPIGEFQIQCAGRPLYLFFVAGAYNSGGSSAFCGWRAVLDGAIGGFIGSSIEIPAGRMITHASGYELGTPAAGTHTVGVHVENGTTPSTVTQSGFSLAFVIESY